MQDPIEIKSKLLEQCLIAAEKSVSALQQILQDTQEAANNETKSSAGDKHETSRAMAQLETEKLSVQLHEALRLKQTLSQVPNIKNTGSIQLGHLVFTTSGNFYISASIGKIELDNQTYFAISPSSPIGKHLLGKKEKDIFVFNGTAVEITKVL